jgi:hypothetical protein
MIKIKGYHVTICKLIFSKSSKNMQNLNWVYNYKSNLKYKLCSCSNIKCCNSPYKNNGLNY